VIDQAEKEERLLRPKRPEKIPQVLSDSASGLDYI